MIREEGREGVGEAASGREGICRIDCAGEHIDPIPTPTLTLEDMRALGGA